MGYGKSDFDVQINLHDEIKSFIIKNSADCLYHFHHSEKSKFNRTCRDTDRQNLSSNAICTYAMAQYYPLWKEEKVDSKFNSLENYWIYIIDGLKKEDLNPIEAPDEFTIINILSTLRGIFDTLNYGKKNENKITLDNDIKNLIVLLCEKYVENQFAFKENPHPFICYRFSNIIEEWWPEIRVVKGNDLQWFTDTIYQNGKYELYRQISQYYSQDKAFFDVKRLIYSILIVTKHDRYSNNLIKEKALEIVFSEQLEQGIFPLCHVVNNDFVIEKGKITERAVSASPLLSSFECFNDMLSHKYIKEDLKRYNEKFERAYEWIIKRMRKDFYGIEIQGWYPEYESTRVTESWVTSHNLLFLKNYYELLSELIDESAKRYLQATKIENDVKIFNTYGIKEHIDRMVKGEYRSALIFGPPGTGKSTIAKYLASKLDYHYIELTPGVFLSQGPPNIIPTANEIFKRLLRIRKAVVFFDEVDQLLYSRDPEKKGSEELAWIVTALLPKFQELRKQKEIRFMLASNYIDKLDSAISRPGRIDLVLPMGGIGWRDRIQILRIEVNSNIKKDVRDGLKEEIFLDLVDEKNIKKQEDLNPKKYFRLANFLNRTNYMTYPHIKGILDHICNKDYITDVREDELYQFLFKESGANMQYDDGEIRRFHEELISSKLEKVRMPTGVKPELIVDDNMFKLSKNLN